MKKPIILFGLLALMFSCAQHRAYDTAQFREREFVSGQITLSEGGLTEEQINVIMSTKPPLKFPVDISMALLHNSD